MILSLLKWSLVLAFCLIAAVFVAFSPSHLSSVTYRGNTIKIDRDDYGIATIHASSMEDYLYGLGTALAEDRLFQTSFRAYAVQGRLAQFLGEKLLEFDRFMREVNLKKWADLRAERFKKQNISEYLKFQAMVKGVNDRVAMMRFLPLDFHISGLKWQNFTISHYFYFAIQFEWSISMNAADEYTRSALLANFTKQEIDWILPNKKQTWAFKSLPIVTDDEIPERLRTKVVEQKIEEIRFNPLSVERLFELDIIEFFGSMDATNTWAVSGEHTESGLPIVGNDPHLENIVPSQLYPFKINFTYPNGTSSLSIGSSNPGSSHQYGKNPYYGAGFSICHADSQDLYREKIEGTKYFVDGKWRDLKLRNETILVKTPNGLRKDTYEVKETHRGPIINYIFSGSGSYNLENDTISLAWTGYNGEWESQILLTYAIFIDSFEELREMLQNGTRTFIPANIVAVTSDNHIVMQQSGVHPIRRVVESGTYVKDGTTSEHDWVGLVPAEDRMHIVDPPKGYIINSNNKVAESGYYSGYLDYTIYTARADRIDELIRAEIAAGRKINTDFGKRLLLDTVDVYCRQILPEITDVVPEAKGLLSGFDCDFRGDSTQAAIYEVFFYELYHLMKPFSPAKMCLISFHQMQQGLFNYIHFAFRGDVAKQQIMREAWTRALAHLSTHFKTSDSSKWLWGELHIDHARHVPFRAHPVLSKLYDLSFPGVGNMHTPNLAKMELLESGNFETSMRATTRVIYGFGPGHKDWFLVDSGTSQNIFSNHYSDQWELFKRGELIEMTAYSRHSTNNQL